MSPVPYHDGAFPPVALDWQRLIPLIGPANAAIARYAGLLQGIPTPTATRILRVCRDHGILRELRAASGRRTATLCFPELLNIAEGRQAF